MIPEAFLPIPGFEGLYEISIFGRIKSFSGRLKGGIMKPWLNHGYELIELVKNKKRYNFKVHRLMGLTFIPNPLNKKEINHKNCVKNDNHISNLEWSDKQENMDHAVKNNRTRRGENHQRVKLTKAQVLEIKNLKGKLSNEKIAKLYSISSSQVSRIIRNKTWTYDFDNNTLL